MPRETVNDTDLYYETAGDGPPIVFLHGVMMGSRFFTDQLQGLDDEYRPISLDFRGHGRSEKNETGHTIPQYAADVEAFLAAQNVESVILVGWSMGALVGWEYVDQFGTDRLRGFVVVDQHPSDYKWADYDHGAFGLQELIDLLELAQTDPGALAQLFIDEMLKDEPSPEVEQLMFDEISRVPPSIKSAILFDQSMRDYRDALQAVDVPSLVCLGEDEKLLETGGVEYAAEHMPNATLERFPDSGHCPFIEQTEQFNRVLSEFADSL